MKEQSNEATGSVPVSDVIAEAISAKATSYRRLAAEMGCDHAYLNNIVKGRQSPPKGKDFYERLAVALKRDLSSISEYRRAFLIEKIESDARFADLVYENASQLFSGLIIDTSTYGASIDGVSLDLTFMEYELLSTMAAEPLRVFTRESLLRAVWGYDYFGGTRTVDVHIRRLRAKLGPKYEGVLDTVRNVGYRYVGEKSFR